MGQDEASVTLLDNNGVHALLRASKKVLANEILAHLSKLI
jgi:hypothetical protein